MVINNSTSSEANLEPILHPKKRVRTIAAAAALIVTSFGAGVAAEHYAGDNAAKIAQPAPTHGRAPGRNEALNPALELSPVVNEARRSTQLYAKEIFDLGRRSANNPNVSVATRSVDSLSPRDSGSDSYNTTVTVKTNSLLGGSGGEYVLSVFGKMGNDNMVAPDSVSELDMTAYSFKDTTERSADNQIFSFESIALPGDAKDSALNWRIIVRAATKGGIDDVAIYDSQKIEPGVTPLVIQPLTPRALNSSLQQATQAFDWAESGAPVNYITTKPA